MLQDTASHPHAIHDYEALTWAWSLVAAVSMAAGYSVYLTLYLTGAIVPNATTWCLWAIGGTTEAWVYRKLVHRVKNLDESKLDPLEIPAWVCAGFAIVVASLGLGFAAYSAIFNVPSYVAFERPENWELMVAGGDIIVVCIYAGLRIFLDEKKLESGIAEKIAMLLMILDISLSFLPIWQATYHDPDTENPLPWYIWTLGSYAIVAAAGFFQRKFPWRKRWWLVAYPATSALFHGAVGVLATTGGA